MPLSSGERILLYLHTTIPPDGLVGGFDQMMISSGCSIGRTHVPRSMRPLLEQGLVVEEKGRAPGRSRRVKRYSLTHLGQEAASALMAKVRSMRISISGPDGVKHYGDPASVLSIANSLLGQRSERPLSLPLVLAEEGPHLPWEKVLDMSRSVPGTSETVPLPEGWTMMASPVEPREAIPLRQEKDLMDILSSGDIVAVMGRQGSGRRTLVNRVLSRLGLKPAWIRRCRSCDQGEVPLDMDVLVAMEGPPRLDERMEGVSDVADPRDDSWDDELRNLPLILVLDEEGHRTDLPKVAVTGLSRDDFAQLLSHMDIPEWTAIALHSATKGSPLAVSLLTVKDSREIARLAAMPADEVVFRVLMEMGRLKGVSKDT